jgi:hypothetical protein
MTSNDLRCPQCSAHVLPGADWCTLCYADLRVPEVPEAPEPAVPAVATEGSDGSEALDISAMGETDEATEQSAARAGGKHARRATTYANPGPLSDTVPVDEATLAELEARADAMLAQLAAESDAGLHPLVGRLKTKQARLLASLGGGLALVALIVLVMTVLGLFL